MASRYPFVGAAAHLFPKNAIKMLSFSTFFFIRSDLRRCWQSHFYTIQKTFSCTVPPPCSSTGKSTSDPAGLYFACVPSGKMILFTKKKITMEMPPLSTVVPML